MKQTANEFHPKLLHKAVKVRLLGNGGFLKTLVRRNIHEDRFGILYIIHRGVFAQVEFDSTANELREIAPMEYKAGIVGYPDNHPASRINQQVFNNRRLAG